MQGPMAQVIGLVLAVNAQRRGLSVAKWPNGSIYAFCNSVEFVRGSRPGWFGRGRPVVDANPDKWLASLPEGSGARLRIQRRNAPNISDRNAVAFANGGPLFLIEVTGPEPEFWWNAWDVTQRSAADNRIWSVVYRKLDSPLADEPCELSITETGERLRGALDDAIAFSTRTGMGFEDTLSGARDLLDAADPLAAFYRADMVPAGLLELPAQHILACCSSAWVFGGMGSWNDAGFDGVDGVTYTQVSDRLFDAILDGLTVATNASHA